MRYFFSFVIIVFIWACSEDSIQKIDQNQVYSKLKENQSKFYFNIDNKDFYDTSAIFMGHLELLDNYFVINFFDQFGSNVMINFSEKDWYLKKPIKVKTHLVNSYSSTAMIGKVTDKAKNKGDGYLMVDGNLEFVELSKSKIIIKLDGKVKKFPKMDEKDPSYDVEGLIIMKNPEISNLKIPLK